MGRLHFSSTFLGALLLSATQTLAGNVAPPIETPVVIAPVEQPSDWYASIFAGPSFLEDVDTNIAGEAVSVGFDTGFILGATVGKRLNQNWRVEAELSFAHYEADDVSGPTSQVIFGNADGDLNAIFLMANVWYDIPTSGRLTPYVGGGLGAAHVDADVVFDGGPQGYQNGDINFAAQIGAGVSIDLSDKMAVDIGYRYKFIPDVDFDNGSGFGTYTGGDVNSHNVQAGLRFNF